ncbi:hypothetical protein [Craterilacuibacter sinensis]|uniref:DAC domain-containing protein n=1 Tax=Craterilacuibacter sinensis TaxID=2686017 RepID=A0A845BRW3_9NEIS|nr:hypothetical protein [Craterilacuibacter sinensis]MXR37231.1 hypothetical protein [Craterilacuibacter sinensis]
MPVNITFRSKLIGDVHTFCRNSKLSILSDQLNLVELIVLLSRYQEEGVDLSPRVYITSDVQAMTRMLPGGEQYKLGGSSADQKGIKQALKKCAPLATGDWMIYIADAGNKIEYGVFKGESNPISVSIDSILLSSDNDFHTVRVSQLAKDCVETHSSHGDRHYIFLNHRDEDSPPPLQYLESLVEAITSKVPAEYLEALKSYLNKLLYDALRQSHGCLIVVSANDKVPALLSNDGVILENAINFSELVAEVASKSIDSAQLDSKGTLLKGMLNSDGIIVFNQYAQLLGFNCFVKTASTDDVVGGARKRAFTTLADDVGNTLHAAFIQSQDGWSEFKGA